MELNIPFFLTIFFFIRLLADNCFGDQRTDGGRKEITSKCTQLEVRMASMETIGTNTDQGFKQDGGWIGPLFPGETLWYSRNVQFREVKLRWVVTRPH